MTVNFCKRKLNYVWSNFDIGHIVKLFLEQGEKFKQTAALDFWTATHLYMRGYIIKPKLARFYLESTQNMHGV
jgi:hypothetical protein